jgi:hypothetical protein
MLPNAQLIELGLTFGLIISVNWNSFARFLSSQKRLDNLTLSSILPLVIPDEVTFQPLQCQLRFLNLLGLLQGHDPKKEEFIKMLAPSVTNLSISYSNVTTKLMGKILENFKSLDFLLLERVRVIDEEESNDNKSQNSINLKTLTLETMAFDNNSAFVQFLSLFNSIKLLYLHEFRDQTNAITSDNVRTVTSAMQNVTSIAVDGPIGIFRDASFTNLRSLIWSEFDATEDMNWIDFVKNNPNLKLVTLEVTNNRLDCKALLKSASLRKSMGFAITGDFKLTKQRLRIFMTKNVTIYLKKSALMMSGEEFDEIVGDRKKFFRLSDTGIDM